MKGKTILIGNHPATMSYAHPMTPEEQLMHQRTLGNTHRRRLTAAQGEEEPLSNSESKRDADGHESTGSEVKSKRPNDTKLHGTRAPQSGDGGGVLRDPDCHVIEIQCLRI